MKRCPITYLPCEKERYSKEGLALLSRDLHHLHDFPYGEAQQYELILDFSDKISFSGIQPKLSAKLNLSKEVFEVVRSGTFLIKLPNQRYPGLPQNEDLTMKLAGISGINVPKHGMIYAIDGSLVYFIERFDRHGRKKLHVEDFGQLAELPTEQKYDFSMEKIGQLIDQFCTFPILEKEKLFRLTLFNFLVGNEDMHLKNFSLIVRDGIAEFSPAYDLVNSTIAMVHAKEEIALSLRGKKGNLKPNDFFEYYASERLYLSSNGTETIKKQLLEATSKWEPLIRNSFLSDTKKKEYLALVEQRRQRLFL